MDIYIIYLSAFFAGLVDAVVGGGGLILIPALFSSFSSTSAATLLGTNKFTAITGTVFAARTLLRRVTLSWSLILPTALMAFVMSYVGAATVSRISESYFKVVVFILLVIVAVYTFVKKDFGKVHKPKVVGFREKQYAALMGGAIGFYDGLFGPGAGSFLIFLFIHFFAFDFLHASAAAKFVNLATNAAALTYFVPSGNVMYTIVLPMVIFNILGALCGAWLAIHKGSEFVRALFLMLVGALIIKLGYEVFL